MALTLDGTTTLPMMGAGGGMGSGVGLGAVGGGVLGLVAGSMLGNNGGLFGGNNGNAGNAQFDAIQTQISGLQGQVTSAGVHSEINELEGSLNAANIANLQGIANNALLYTNGNAALQTAVAGANFTTLTSINGLGRDITAAQNQGALQQLNSFNNLTTTTLQGFNSLGMQSQNATNQIIAGQTALASTLAACCCEMKGIVAAEGSATRALINDLNVQNLRDQLSAANNKVSNNEQNQYLLSTILAHCPKPCTASSGVIV